MLDILGVSLTTGLLSLAMMGNTQQHPGFSGDWVLISATATAARTSGGTATREAGGETHTTSTTVSGAAFNCGRACTIVQNGDQLTIRNSLLADASEPARPITLRVDGRPAQILDSFSPNRKIPATAAWKGDTVVITSSTGSHAITQTLSIEGSQLVVVTAAGMDPTHPVTFRYERKRK